VSRSGAVGGSGFSAGAASWKERPGAAASWKAGTGVVVQPSTQSRWQGPAPQSESPEHGSAADVTAKNAMSDRRTKAATRWAIRALF
jgi:hypothetical protein